MLAKGTLLQNRYLIKGLLGQGGMGAVYEAEAIHLGNIRVAVKETLHGGDPHLREQFQREASMLARLRHPALPLVSDHFTESDGQFLVMDFIPGDDLGHLFAARNQPFEPDLVLSWAETLLGALDHIHTQQPPIIHRDIKPENIKLTPHGRVFLIDFGLAKDEANMSRSGKSLHAYTLAYAPPEQLSGQGGTDARSDIYSLGATLYHLLTGKLPADARLREQSRQYAMPDPLLPVHHINAQIPFAVAAVIARAMTLERSERYQSAATMRGALLEARQSPMGTTLVGTEALPPPITSNSGQPQRETRALSHPSGAGSRTPSGRETQAVEAPITQGGVSVHFSMAESQKDAKPRRLLFAAVAAAAVVIVAAVVLWWSKNSAPAVTTPTPTPFTAQATPTPASAAAAQVPPQPSPTPAAATTKSKEPRGETPQQKRLREAKEALERSERLDEAKKALERKPQQ
jgi:serine/threonine protein kinase